MQFAPVDGTRFYGAHGWRGAEFLSIWEESRRLDRQMALAWLWGLLARFAPRRRREEWLRLSGVVRLERATS